MEMIERERGRKRVERIGREKWNRGRMRVERIGREGKGVESGRSRGGGRGKVQR